ncbi:MAG: hypothetical protein HEP71_06320 [Roseivirga sp.]|nr:hypothetical protein [Roseivirga sp.]
MKLETKEDVREAFKICRKNYTEANKKLAFKCIQRAKWLKDPELEFDARDSFIAQAVFLNYKEEAISMFAKQIEYADSRELKFSQQLILLWSYKWIMSALPSFSDIPKERIDNIFTDFETRINNSRWPGKTVVFYKGYLAYSMGRPEEALKLQEKLEIGTSRDVMDDCKACQIDGSLDLLIDMGQYGRVEKLVEPIVAGELTCKDVPRRTYSKLVKLYYLKGNWEMAEKYDALAKKDMDEKLFKSGSYARMLPFWGISKKFIRGIEVIPHQLTFITERVSALRKFNFYLACTLFFRAMKLYDEQWTSLNINLSDRESSDVLILNDSGQYGTESLETWFRSMATKRAKKLDTRNGNSFYIDKMHKESQTFDEQLEQYRKNEAP